MPRLGLLLLGGTLMVILATVALYVRAAAHTNHAALAGDPKPVTTVTASAGQFQPLREYVGMTESWNEAKLGPQYVSAYVASVLVRPGARVKGGQVVATLDCRFASASSRETAARGQSIAERQAASQREAARVQQIAAGGFASANEVDQLRARAASEHADIDSVRAVLTTKRIEVNDCTLRAPFDGDVVARSADPGAYVRPGEPVLTIADRSTIRVAADAPENDFTALAPGTEVSIEIAAVNAHLKGPISRRIPSTDPSTRTIHFEVDIDDRQNRVPIGATALERIAVGQPRAVTQLPLQAASLREDKASLFVIEKEIARRKDVAVLGQRGGLLYVDPSALPAGAKVVLDGRALLDDGDRVTAHAATDDK